MSYLIGFALLIVIVLLLGKKTPTAQPLFDATHEETDEYLSLDDPLVPDWVREQSHQYRDPVQWVMPDGDDGYLLFTADGDLIDGIYLK